MIALELTPPTAITADHQLADFDSGEVSLDDWLKKRAEELRGWRFAMFRPLLRQDGCRILQFIGRRHQPRKCA